MSFDHKTVCAENLIEGIILSYLINNVICAEFNLSESCNRIVITGLFGSLAAFRLNELNTHSHNVKELAVACYACNIAVNGYLLAVILCENRDKLCYGIGDAADNGAPVNIYVEVAAGYCESTGELHKLDGNRRCGSVRVYLCRGKLAEVGGRREACVVTLGVYGVLAELLRSAVDGGLALYGYNVAEGNVGCPGVAKIYEDHSAVILKNEGLGVVAHYYACGLVVSKLAGDNLCYGRLGCRGFIGYFRIVGSIGYFGLVGCFAAFVATARAGVTVVGSGNLGNGDRENVRILLRLGARYAGEVAYDLDGLAVKSRESYRILCHRISDATHRLSSVDGKVVIGAGHGEYAGNLNVPDGYRLRRCDIIKLCSCKLVGCGMRHCLTVCLDILRALSKLLCTCVDVGLSFDSDNVANLKL